MSIHQAFRRSAVQPQAAQQLRTITIPAPTRGLVLNENESFMQPGAALVLDNWAPTMKGIKLRGGCTQWATLPEATPVISMFQYISGNNQRMYAGNLNKLYDVTTPVPVEIKAGQTSGNYVASQLANQGGDWMIVLNDTGDYPLRFNGTTWVTLDGTPPANWLNNTAYAVNAKVTDAADGSRWKCAVANTSAAAGTFADDRIARPTFWTADPFASDGTSWITGPPESSVVNGHNLTYVWKYRGHLYFIEGGTMNAWYLPINAVGGTLQMIPLAGAATKGGKLLAGFTWSLDAGDGIDDKCVFMTDQGELLIFTGSDPSTIANWRQEGRYQTSVPLGMNAHIAVGGDVMIATVDGIIPISASITKDSMQLELAAITRAIKPMWRDMVNARRTYPWTLCKFDEYGGMFVTYPGGNAGSWYCGVVNIATGAWARYVGWDAMCFCRLRSDMFFGTQTGKIMQADRTGYDDGVPYIATMVGGWEMFSSQSSTLVWRQSRAAFSARAGEPFQPQLSCTTDYVIVIPTPPSAAPDPGVPDVWGQGLWGPDLRPPVPSPWKNATVYTAGTKVYDPANPPNNTLWTVAINHTSAATGLFTADRAAHPTYWTAAGTYPSPPTPTAPEIAQYAQWDQPAPSTPVMRSTMWISIGYTGFSHAPICQVTVAQQARPEVELISIAATYEPAGVNV